MVAQQVDAVWVWNYTLSNQKAVYGRFPGDTTFTKDYLQMPQASGILLRAKFPKLAPTAPLALTYEWRPVSTMSGFLNYSSDRYHLSWATGARGPAPWRLAPQPTAAGPETFPGDPDARTAASANAALTNFASLKIDGVLLAVKLVGQADRLHLRAYVVGAPSYLRFADASQLPASVRSLTVGFRSNLACQSADFTEPGSQPVYFDPDLNHDCWSLTAPPVVLPLPAPSTPPLGAPGAGATTATPTTSQPSATTGNPLVSGDTVASDDVLAEAGVFDPSEVTSLDQQISNDNYAVPDATATVKTRGSAQRAFAKAVKTNYGFKCAITGISTREFLVASHIVPWADDESIRLDPRNGICLSTLVDRAFDSGLLTIDSECIVHIDLAKLSGDQSLESALAPYDGTRLAVPASGAPHPDYLRRRLASGAGTTGTTKS